MRPYANQPDSRRSIDMKENILILSLLLQFPVQLYKTPSSIGPVLKVRFFQTKKINNNLRYDTLNTILEMRDLLLNWCLNFLFWLKSSMCSLSSSRTVPSSKSGKTNLTAGLKAHEDISRNYRFVDTKLVWQIKTAPTLLDSSCHS